MNQVRNPIVGDVLQSTWGSNKTYVTFYLVTKASKDAIEIRSLRNTESLSDKKTVVPNLSAPMGVPMSKSFKVAATFYYLKINLFAGAFLWDGTPAEVSV